MQGGSTEVSPSPPSWVTTDVFTARCLPWAHLLQSKHSHGKQSRLHAHGKPHEVLLLPFKPSLFSLPAACFHQWGKYC